MSEYKLKKQKPPSKPVWTEEEIREFFRREGSTLAFLAVAVAILSYARLVGFDHIAKSALAWGKNLLDWIVVGVVAVTSLAFTLAARPPFRVHDGRTSCLLGPMAPRLVVVACPYPIPWTHELHAEAAQTDDNSCATSDALYRAAVEMIDRGTNPRLFTAESEYTALLIFGALADLFAALARVAELECKLAGARMTTAKPGLH